jgi:hypothetical protein
VENAERERGEGIETAARRSDGRKRASSPHDIAPPSNTRRLMIREAGVVTINGD